MMKAAAIVLQGVRPMGCGVACVASVVRRRYGSALRLFRGLRGDDVTRGYARRSLIAALGRAGLPYVFTTLGPHTTRLAEAEALPPKSIVYVSHERYGRAGHYLVRTSTGWMDPLCGHVARLPGYPRSAIVPLDP